MRRNRPHRGTTTGSTATAQISSFDEYWVNSLLLIGVSFGIMIYNLYIQADFFLGIGEILGLQFAFLGSVLQMIGSVFVPKMRVTPNLWTPGFFIEALIIGLGMAVLFTAFSNGELREYVIPHPIGIIIFIIFLVPQIESVVFTWVSNFCENNSLGIFIYWAIIVVQIAYLGYYLIQVFG